MIIINFVVTRIDGPLLLKYYEQDFMIQSIKNIQ